MRPLTNACKKRGVDGVAQPRNNNNTRADNIISTKKERLFAAT
jgi:hypothetical protein